MNDLHVQLLPAPPKDGPQTWFARIDDTTFPVLGYAASNDEQTGEMILSLVLAPGRMSIGEAPPARQSAEKAFVSTWGASGQPDPRENIPGWSPGQQAAGDVQAVQW